MQHPGRFVWLIGSVLILGCTTSVGLLPLRTQSAQLDRANFRVVQSNARGQDSGFKLFSLVPIVSPSLSDAMDSLQEGIEAEGRAISLVNMTQETRTLHLLLFSVSTIIVRADVIEFLDGKGPNQEQ